MLNSKALGTHQDAYDAVFRHPIAHNLQWRDLRAMLEAYSESTEDNGDKVKFARNGVTLTVHVPQHKDFSDSEQLMKVRHYLENAEPKATASATQGDGKHVLVVIDHREARVYTTEMHGAVPERIVPHSEDGSHRHLHNVETQGDGQRKPETASFYEAISRKLMNAEKILLFGSATGSSSAMDHLMAELTKNHPALADRVIGKVVVDEHHMSDDQLLAEAREFYAHTVALV